MAVSRIPWTPLKRLKPYRRPVSTNFDPLFYLLAPAIKTKSIICRRLSPTNRSLLIHLNLGQAIMMIARLSPRPRHRTQKVRFTIPNANFMSIDLTKISHSLIFLIIPIPVLHHIFQISDTLSLFFWLLPTSCTVFSGSTISDGHRRRGGGSVE